MGNLKCEEKNCSYNRNLFCLKKVIAINEQSTCVSFQKRRKANQFNYEIASDNFLNTNIHPEIQCNDLECIHNRNRNCTAKSVNIARSAFQPVNCKTFQAKD